MRGFLIIPAIDLREGRCVRLVQGRLEEELAFSGDPVAVAREWESQGAEWLHVVNLDGAFGLASENLKVLERILKEVSIPVQFGGGLRDMKSIRRALSLGVARVILGTVAIKEPELVKVALERFGNEKITVGIDARQGWVATHGWQETTPIRALELARRMEDLGIQRAVFTDIERDGMLTGPNIEAIRELAEGTNLKIIASGGISSLADIRALAELEPLDLEGVILGRALYEGKVNLMEAIETFAG